MIFYHFLSSMIYEEKFNRAETRGNTDVESKTIEMMQNKVDKIITLTELASFVNLSVTHFSTIFRKHTGYSPIEYFNHLKIQKARQYLSFTKMPVKEIAHTIRYYRSILFFQNV